MESLTTKLWKENVESTTVKVPPLGSSKLPTVKKHSEDKDEKKKRGKYRNLSITLATLGKLSIV